MFGSMGSISQNAPTVAITSECRQGSPAGAGGRIVVVDDSSTNLLLLEDILVTQGHQVQAFTRGGPALAAIDAAPFVVSLELRESAVTALADVVFPVAPVVEKAGSFMNWEGRVRPFGPSLHTNAIPDLRVLAFLADELGVDLNMTSASVAGDEMARTGLWAGQRPPSPQEAPSRPTPPGKGQAVLAGWRMLLDTGRLQDGERHLAGTARPPVARLSAATAEGIGAAEGQLVTVGTDRGEITLPLAITDMVDGTVWLPLNSPGSAVHQQLGVTSGAVVTIGRAD